MKSMKRNDIMNMDDIMEKSKGVCSRERGSKRYFLHQRICHMSLPENLKKEVLDYIDFLLEKYQGKKVRKRKFTFDWEGGLSDIKDFTSGELQHKALEWR